MPKTSDVSLGTPDAENPEWTAERIRRAKRLTDLPESLQKKLRQLPGFAEAGSTQITGQQKPAAKPRRAA